MLSAAAAFVMRSMYSVINTRIYAQGDLAHSLGAMLRRNMHRKIASRIGRFFNSHDD
jgi:hypothetical protein